MICTSYPTCPSDPERALCALVADAIEGDADGWRMLRETRRVDQLQIDFRFGMVLDDGTHIVIEGPFVATLDGVSVTVIPETLEGVGAALAVLHRDLSDLRAWRSGALRVAVSDGGAIDVPPGDAFENWQVTLADGSRLIGLPGGGVATYPSTR